MRNLSLGTPGPMSSNQIQVVSGLNASLRGESCTREKARHSQARFQSQKVHVISVGGCRE